MATKSRRQISARLFGHRVVLIWFAFGLTATFGVAGTSAHNRVSQAPAIKVAVHADPVAEAKRLVSAASRPAIFRAPGPAFRISPSLRGKTIWYVSLALNFPFSQLLFKGVKDAGAAAG